ncbi:MAG TPA: tyrosine-type recombinase/integrase [Thermoleophilaceae bacterium]|nr:tyrosine-type recombinase/integrase [Thermoleophilaceae bacterium]
MAGSGPRGGKGGEGVVVRHRRACAIRAHGSCSCRPAYQAQAYSAREQRTIRRTFASLAEARGWRQDTQVALRRRKLRAPTRTTLSEAAAEWLSAAKAGVVRTRSGEPYKPSALRSYAHALETKLLPALGHKRLSELERNDVQDLVDRLVAAGLAPSTVRNAVLPLRAIYRRSVERSEVAINPTEGLRLPAVRGGRDRIARPQDAEALLAALRPEDRALWASALYAGLRRGELQGLRWSDVDFERGVISVERGWDRVVGPIAPKSRTGRRRVPLSATLRRHLAEHRLRQGRGGDGLCFGSVPERAFDPPTVSARARAAWQRADLEPISLHECRHTYAAFMVAAGVNAKALQTYLGHSSITVTLDRYGHLMPGAEGEAAAMLEAYLTKASR